MTRPLGACSPSRLPACLPPRPPRPHPPGAASPACKRSARARRARAHRLHACCARPWRRTRAQGHCPACQPTASPHRSLLRDPTCSAQGAARIPDAARSQFPAVGSLQRLAPHHSAGTHTTTTRCARRGRGSHGAIHLRRPPPARSLHAPTCQRIRLNRRSEAGRAGTSRRAWRAGGGVGCARGRRGDAAGKPLFETLQPRPPSRSLPGSAPGSGRAPSGSPAPRNGGKRRRVTAMAWRRSLLWILGLGCVCAGHQGVACPLASPWFMGTLPHLHGGDA